MQVPQAAFAFFHIGLKHVATIAEAIVPLLALFQLGGHEGARIIHDIRPEMLAQFIP